METRVLRSKLTITDYSRDPSLSSNGGEYHFGYREVSFVSDPADVWLDGLNLNPELRIWDDTDRLEILGERKGRIYYRLTEEWTSAEFPFCPICGRFGNARDCCFRAEYPEEEWERWPEHAA